MSCASDPSFVRSILTRPSNYSWSLLCFFAIAALGCVAWVRRFMLDDAFISFRYASNLASGMGFVWNPGEKVEGYSNFLWTVLMVLPHFYGLDPVFFASVVGLAAFLGSLILTYKLMKILSGSRNLALLAMVAVGANYSFNSYATGGLETSLTVALTLSSLYILFRCNRVNIWSAHYMTLLSAVLGLLILNRLDSSILVAIIVCAASSKIYQNDSSITGRLGKWVCLVVPMSLLLASWMIWKFFYYGQILPNTFFVKIDSQTSVFRGGFYVFVFLMTYQIIPFVVLFTLGYDRLIPELNFETLILILFIFLWCLYIVAVGGDFMEFRFIMPILPPLIIITVLFTDALFIDTLVRRFLFALIVFGSLSGIAFYGALEIESIRTLKHHLTAEGCGWINVGKFLGKVFPAQSEITIATTAAGAIPYYSGLRTIDMLGLNDAFISRHGITVGTRPGHQKTAPFDYLLKRQVDIVIGHPLFDNHKMCGL